MVNISVQCCFNLKYSMHFKLCAYFNVGKILQLSKSIYEKNQTKTKILIAYINLSCFVIVF